MIGSASQPAGSPGTISTRVRGEARRKCTRLRNKEGGTDFYRLGLAGAAWDGSSHARFVFTLGIEGGSLRFRSACGLWPSSR